MNMTFNFSKSTQYGTQFGVSSITQNGYTTGQLSTVSVDSDGRRFRRVHQRPLDRSSGSSPSPISRTRRGCSS